eukprot:TRINITY_DN2927_c0_g2_i1.p1 TRINITY_DN2927_c0_g2~~TRINITY_DN2927_c0_g2_i1.p1  ORF type:complete len:329 (+),score=60.98 TRINITY_DN2927_c0_g2_i1:56-1042(+)
MAAIATMPGQAMASLSLSSITATAQKSYSHSFSLSGPSFHCATLHSKSKGSFASQAFLGTQLRLARVAPSCRSSSLTSVVATVAAEEEEVDYEGWLEVEETEEEIEAAYEKMYGKAFGATDAAPSRRSLGGEDDEEEQPARRRRGGRGRSDDSSDSRDGDRGGDRQGKSGDMEDRVIQVRRVTKVVKGGKQMAFRAVVVVGDKKGKVGVGVGKAKEVVTAVQKAGVDARRHMVVVPMTKYSTFPHRADGHFGAATVMLRPAATGTGVIAGGSVRVVLELAGVENALGKELGSGNPLNNVRATLDAVSNMKTFKQVSELRGIPMEELWK